MKRSTQVSLVLLASVSAVATLSGCNDQPEQIADNGGTFTTMAECVAVYDQQTCSAAQSMANQEHLANAPHFNTLQSCVAEYGADMCRSGSSYGGSSNVFLPLMAGYMLGSATSTPAPLYYGSIRDRDRYHYANGSAPIYTSGRGYSRSAPIGAAPYRSTAGLATTKGGLKSGTAISTGTVPTQRGGFGTSFKPAKTFTSSYKATNPTSFGRAALPATSARATSISSSRGYASSSSVSSRGGFGSSARGFSGGFGG